MRKRKIFQLTFSILFSTLLVVGLVYAWTAPSQDPPGGNVEAPINVSDTAQSKLGDFGLGGGAGQPLYWLKNIGGALYFSSTNPAGDRVVIGQDGKVGIGITGPAEKLEVNGAIKIGTTSNTNAGTIRWTGTDFEGYTGSNWVSLTSGGGGLWTDQGTYIYPNNYNQFVITDTGNVGIGTTDPGAKLDIVGDTRVQGWDAVYKSFDTGGGANKTFHLIGTYHGWDSSAVYIAGYNYYNPAGGNVDNSYAKKIHFGRPERMTVDLGTGNVGIGTTDPQAKLDVRGKIYANNPPAAGYGSVVAKEAVTAVRGDTTHYGYFEGRRSDNKRGFYLGWGNGGDLVNLYLDNANKLGITGGNVGIGTTDPSQKLEIHGNIKMLDDNYIINEGDQRGYSKHSWHYWIDSDKNENAGYYFNAHSTYYGGGTKNLMTIRDNGNVGIGTTNPQGRLHIKAAGSKVIIEI